MTKLSLEMQQEMARRLGNQGYLTENQVNGFKTRGNKGMLGEMEFVKSKGIKTTFDNKQGADFIINGIKVQFKYMGYESNPSATETKKHPDESNEQFVDRIVDIKYKEVDEFWIYLDDDFEFNDDRIIKLNRNQFKKLLLTQNIKDNKKIRITRRAKVELFRYQ